MPISPSRNAAFRVLLRIAQTDAFVDEMLHGPLFEDLSPPDQRLATEIVLGTLRQRGALDALLEQALSRPVAKLDIEVLTALRLGAYQMRYLDRVPERAAVSESVELVKRGPKRSASGLVNAVLRKLPPRSAPDVELELSMPAWLRTRWEQHYGKEAAGKMAAASQARPTTYLRLSSQGDLNQLADRLTQEGVETAATEVPTARRLVSGRVEATAAWQEGLVRVQDLSAQMVVPLLEFDSSHRLLDLCAAPGGKAAQAASLCGSASGIVACDRHAHRLHTMRGLAAEPFNLVVLDAEQALPFRRTFDRVLVDAPCSGTGTLAHNPDLKWRLRPSDLPELAERQKRILNQALDALSPTGIAVYATCSVEPEENIAVVEAALGQKPGWRIGDRLERLPGRDEGDGFFAVQIIPS